MTVRCKLFGCREIENAECVRCGTHIYEGFIQSGLLSPSIRTLKRLLMDSFAKVAGRKCDVCKRRFWRGYDGYTCSEQCFNEWLPF